MKIANEKLFRHSVFFPDQSIKAKKKKTFTRGLPKQDGVRLIEMENGSSEDSFKLQSANTYKVVFKWVMQGLLQMVVSEQLFNTVSLTTDTLMQCYWLPL